MIKNRRKAPAFVILTTLTLPQEDMTMSNFIALAHTTSDDGKQSYDVTDEIQISYKILKKYTDFHPLRVMFENKDEITTTVGRVLVNQALFGDLFEVQKHIDFINEPFTKDRLGALDSKMAILLKEDKITSEMYIEYLNRLQWVSYGNASVMAPSLNYDIVKPVPEVRVLRDKLIEENKDKLNDITTVGKIEKELLKLADEKLREKNVPGLMVYDSGNGSFSNNYKNSQVMAGMMPRSNDLSKMDFVADNLADGIQINNIHKSADKMVIASFSRAVGTQDGGYLTKIINSSFSHVVLNQDPQSDCGTKFQRKVTIDKGTMSEYHLRYVIDNGKIERLTEEFINANMGKTFDIRSPMYCVGEQICSRCAGDLYHQLGIMSIGGAFSKMSSRLNSQAQIQ